MLLELLLMQQTQTQGLDIPTPSSTGRLQGAEGLGHRPCMSGMAERV